MATKDISDIKVCEAIREYQLNNSIYADEILMKMTNQVRKVCIKAMERAENKDLIEYGVSLRTAWLTNKGLELLKSNAKH